MVSEQITVMTTPTPIIDLISTARSGTTIPAKCIGIMLRYAIAETATVTLADDNSGTGAIVLDASEKVYSTVFKQIKLDTALLSCSTGTVTVHIIVEQDWV